MTAYIPEWQRNTSSFMRGNFWASTQRCGLWPTIFILGAQKSATTSLMTTIEAAGHVWQTHGEQGLVTWSGRRTSKLESTTCCALTAEQLARTRGPPPVGRHPCTYETHFLENCLTSESYRAAHGGRIGQTDSAYGGPFLPCKLYPELFDRSMGIAAADPTPAMLPDGRAPRLLFTLIPRSLVAEVSFIVILRHPTERLYSAFRHMRYVFAGGTATGWNSTRTTVRRIANNTSFDEWGHDLLNRWHAMDAASRYRAVLCEYPSPSMGPAIDLLRGYYYLQLVRWLDVWPRHQMLILNFHELIKPHSPLVQNAIAFATSSLVAEVAASGLPASQAAVLANTMQRHIADARLAQQNQRSEHDAVLPNVSCGMQASLEEHYQPHLELLYALLNSTRDQAPTGELPFPVFERASLVADCPAMDFSLLPALDDQPSPEMQRRNVTCTSRRAMGSFVGPNARCAGNLEWRLGRYCAFSCLVYGMRYTDDPPPALAAKVHAKRYHL